jgi:hypothetical protein
MMVGKQYRLEPRDLWRATRQINLPEVIKEESTSCILPVCKFNLFIGKFLELWTVWTALPPTEGAVDKTLSQRIWRTRQIGVLFAKVDGMWIYLVLMAPLSVTYDYEVTTEDEFNFCYRDPKAYKEKPYAWVASEAPIRDIISFITNGLQKKGPRFMTHLMIDVFWGWERYLAQVRNDIRGVLPDITLIKHFRSCSNLGCGMKYWILQYVGDFSNINLS